MGPRVDEIRDILCLVDGNQGQVLTDFVVEWTKTQMDLMPMNGRYWVMYFNGLLMKDGVGGSLVFMSPLGEQLWHAVQLHFQASNNMAEYEAYA